MSCLAALAFGGCVVYDRAPVSRPSDPPLSREEAHRLLSAGVSEGVIGEFVDRRGVEPLDADAVAALKKAGASDPLLQKMIQAVRKEPPPEEVVADGPYPYYYGYPYGYYPAYASVGFGFGYSYGHYGHYHGCRPSYRGVRVYR